MRQQQDTARTVRQLRLAAFLRSVMGMAPLIFLVTVGAFVYTLWESGLPHLLSLLVAFAGGGSAFLLLYGFFWSGRLYWLVLFGFFLLVGPKLVVWVYGHEQLDTTRWQLEVVTSVSFFGCFLVFRRRLGQLLSEWR